MPTRATKPGNKLNHVKVSSPSKAGRKHIRKHIKKAKKETLSSQFIRMLAGSSHLRTTLENIKDFLKDKINL